MKSPPTLLFLCPHNAAKSVLAVVDCRIELSRRGLSLDVDSAGTEPDDMANPIVVKTLLEEGIDVRGHRPRRITPDDMDGAWRIVSMGCEPELLARYAKKVERWDDVPPVSRDLPAARAAIRQHLNEFLDRLEPIQEPQEGALR